MGEHVTFLAKDPGGNVLDVVAVTVHDTNDMIVVQEQFGPGVPGTSVRTTVLPAGDYFVTARTDGYRFPFRYPVTVLPGSGPHPDYAFAVELPGEPSVSPETSTPVRVYGWVDLASPNATPGSPLQSHGQTYDDGPTTHTTSVAHTVWFERVTSNMPGEARSLSGKARSRVAPDRNGYFEALLDPDTLFRVSLPHVSGVQFIRTPVSGEAELKSLVDASKTVPLYKLV